MQVAGRTQGRGIDKAVEIDAIGQEAVAQQGVVLGLEPGDIWVAQRHLEMLTAFRGRW